METRSTLLANRKFTSNAIPLVISVFIIFVTLGVVLGILPAYLKNNLEINNFTIGLVVSVQFIATLATRSIAGKTADTKGANTSFYIGVSLIILTGILYCLSILFKSNPVLLMSILILGRITHGIGESFLLTGSLSWGISLLGIEQSGKFMSWTGIAIFGGITVGAPLSIFLSKDLALDIIYILALIAILPLICFMATTKLPKIKISKQHTRVSFFQVVKLIINEGLTLGLSSVAYACIVSFITLLFMEKNWGDASLAFFFFGFFYLIIRVLFSSLPDRFGGHKIAVLSLIVEIVGQLIIFLALSKTWVIIGCALTGIGASLIFPALGVIILKRVSPDNKGTALGAYSAFFDISLGITGPIAGLIAGYFTYSSVYFFAAIACLIAIVIISNRVKTSTLS
ncbi:MFS transporter [Myroides odoratimimus]|uniref:MFS transporter n=1 Tax=Myroides odoratimimus TaxID=76832 RepID=UPI0031010061